MGGVKETARTAEKAKNTAQKAKLVVEEVKKKSDAIAAQVRSQRQMVLQELGRWAAGSAIMGGVSELIPQDSQNAFSALRPVAENIPYYSVMLSSIKGGFLVGGIVSAIQIFRKSLSEFRAELQQERARRERIEERQELAFRQLNARIENQDALNVQRITEAEERLYNDALSG